MLAAAATSNPTIAMMLSAEMDIYLVNSSTMS